MSLQAFDSDIEDPELLASMRLPDPEIEPQALLEGVARGRRVEGWKGGRGGGLVGVVSLFRFWGEGA